MSTEQPAAQRAYAVLKEAILDGSRRGGELLSEVEVGAPLGLSRTPVHEAFLRLESEGLLELIPRRGAVVVPVLPSEARDVLEVRRALETAAVRRLSEDGPSAASDRARLHRDLHVLLEAQWALADARDVEAFAVADERFHRAIVDAAGNALAISFYARLADRQRRMTVGSVGARPDRLPALITEHEQLASLVDLADPDAFDTALTAHMTATHAALMGGAL